MIAQNFEFSTPASLADALQLLADAGAKPLAGGMSLVPLMKLRLAAPDRLVDLRHVPGLNSIKEENGALHIGAMATHYELESTPLVRSKCPLLAETASNIGDVQVRNSGTIGGSVAHADPAADYPAALQALEATVSIASPKGVRTLPIAAFLLDPFTTALEPGELVTAITVPVEAAGCGTSYKKCLQPASGFAIVGVAARIAKHDGKVSMARIGVTGLGGKSYRATAVEKRLEGSAGSAADIAAAAAMIADGIDANGDIHASAEYRRHLAPVYAARAITTALGRAK